MSSKTILATTQHELEGLAVILHDQWMNTDEVRASGDGSLVVPMLVRDDKPFSTSGGWWKRRHTYHRRRALRDRRAGRR